MAVHARRLLLSLLLCALPGSPVAARPPAPDAVLTLAEAVRLATQRSPWSIEADAAVASADASLAIASLRPNPTLGLEAENIDGNGIYAGGAMRETTAALALPIELGGKRAARVRVAEAERRAALIATDAARAETVLVVTRAFVALVASERRRTLARERQGLADAALAVARSRVGAGAGSPIEQQRAELARLDAGLERRRAERSHALAEAQLARLTGLPLPLAIAAPWFDTVDAPAMHGDSPTDAPALALAAADSDEAAARLDLALRGRVPDVTVSAGLRHAAEPGDTAAIIGIALPLPVFDSGRAEVARAAAEVDRAQARRQLVRQEFDQALDQARAEFEIAREAAQMASGPALAAAREAARIARVGHEAGKLPQLDLIEAERALSRTREAAIDALATLHDAHATLSRLHGRVDPIFKD